MWQIPWRLCCVCVLFWASIHMRNNCCKHSYRESCTFSVLFDIVKMSVILFLFHQHRLSLVRILFGADLAFVSRSTYSSMCATVRVWLLLLFSHRSSSCVDIVCVFFSRHLSIVCTLSATCVSMFACIHQNKLTLIFSHFLFLASCCTLRITKISSVLLYTITSKLSSHTIYIPLKKRKIQVNTTDKKKRRTK